MYVIESCDEGKMRRGASAALGPLITGPLNGVPGCAVNS